MRLRPGHEMEDMVTAHLTKLRARRGRKTLFTQAGRTEVRTPGEQTIWLPNGQPVKVTTDDSGVATQVEEDERQHAVVRPHAIQLNLRQR